MAKGSNLPIKHHFVPEFYLKAWMGGDGKVTEFRKWPNRISIRRAHPAATGFVNRLYSLEGLPDEAAQELETGFFGPVDGRAATAHVKLRENRLDSLSDAERVGWVTFMNSMLMRTPQDLAIVRGRWLDILFEGNPDWEARFASTRIEGEPLTLKEAAEAIPLDELKRSALRTLVEVISGRNIVQAISRMHWDLFMLDGDGPAFMTSDAPVIRTNGIGRPEGFLAMPISPGALFVSAQRRSTLDRFKALSAKELAGKVNEQIVGSASGYVYALDESQSRFVMNRFGRAPLPRLVNEVGPW